MNRPDFTRVYRGLKDFQYDTVDYVFRRMFRDDPPVKRFLVADEVGLGKTLVARGVIAKAIEHMWEDVDRIDIVYICSNSDIARQNIRRLNVTDQHEFAFAQRLTLMALEMRNLAQNKINFVSFTPGTSFDLKEQMGWTKERAVLFWLMQRVWGDDVITPRRQGDLRTFTGWARLSTFQVALRQVAKAVETIDEELFHNFRRAVRDHERACRAERRPTLRRRFEHLRQRFMFDLAHRPEQDWQDRSGFIGELRSILARSIVNALQPDLVILDEFQRFKHLLDSDTDAARLARELFTYDSPKGAARVLLLSATPYKMYTLAEECDQDDHYADFLRTTGFLLGKRTRAFERELSEYRAALMQLGGDTGSRDRVLGAKRQVERRLRKVMVRTERLAIRSDRSGMLREKSQAEAGVLPGDLLGYVAFDRFATTLGASGDVEYWKSIPCFPNFMDGYELGRQFERAQGDPHLLDQARAALQAAGVIDWGKFRGFRAIDTGNGRFRGISNQLLDAEAWKLLWMPPVLPYYEPGKPYNAPAAADLTKRLVFSAWNGVPRSVASLLSYDAERRMVAAGHGSYQNTPEDRAKLKELLRFTESKGRLTGMPVLALLYPSPALAQLGDPLAIAAQLGAAQQPVPLTEFLGTTQQAVAEALHPLPVEQDGRVDERWYWAAPLLLDQLQGNAAWLRRPQAIEAWAPDRSTQGLERHVAEALTVLGGEARLGRQPDDLVEILSWLALAGPANAALRSIRRMIPDGQTTAEMRYAAARVAGAFRSLFNLPEVRFVVRLATPGVKAYWQKALRYCLNGNLQAVLDEYVHVLREWMGILDPSAERATEELGRALASAVSLRAANYMARDPGKPWDVARETIRSRFALQFGQRQTDMEGELQRSEDVRTAFNSPFWPFVLASTSVGQEGLDFHLYCHAIVHWNLPANPVDLEQREGRIHRYKGHAVRKNVAAGFRAAAFQNPPSDPWQKMFAAATAARSEGDSDLVPYWVLPGPAAIERHVPVMPLSREVQRLANLRRTLAVYRLVFGQPRQEDLIEFLLSRGLDRAEIDLLVDELRVDLRPPCQKRRRIEKPATSALVEGTPGLVGML